MTLFSIVFLLRSFYTDILLHRYFDGCDGAGADCKPLHTCHYRNSIIDKKLGSCASCDSAFRTFDQTFEQVSCQSVDVCAKLPISKNARYLTIDLGWPDYYLLLVRKGCSYFLLLVRGSSNSNLCIV